MSKEGSQGVILTKEGTFESVCLPKNQTVRIGEEINLGARRVIRIPKSALSALAACLLLFAALGAFGLGSQNKAVAAYVSFDINPSFEAGLNPDLHIVSVHPMNKDGSKLLSQVKDYKNLSLDEFTQKVAKALDDDGYFEKDPHLVVSVTVTPSLSKEKAVPLETKISKALDPIQKTPDFKNSKGVVQVIKTSMSTHDKAAKLGFTAGKYTLYKNAARKSDVVTAEKAKTMTVGELINVTHPDVPKNKGTKAIVPPPQVVNSNGLKGKKGPAQKPVQSIQKKNEHLTKKVNPHKTGTTKTPSNQKGKQAKKAVQNVEKQDEHGHKRVYQQRKKHPSAQSTHRPQKKNVKKKPLPHEKKTDHGHLNHLPNGINLNKSLGRL